MIEKPVLLCRRECLVHCHQFRWRTCDQDIIERRALDHLPRLSRDVALFTR